MKIRNGFVSNSSSSSFVLCNGNHFDSGYSRGSVYDAFSALVPKEVIPISEEVDECPITWLEKKIPNEFDYTYPYEGGKDFIIGRIYSSMPLSQTRGEFEREVAIEILRLFPKAHTFQRRLFGRAGYG